MIIIVIIACKVHSVSSTQEADMKVMQQFAIGATAILLGACASSGVQTASVDQPVLTLDRKCADTSSASCTVDKTEQRRSAMRGEFRSLEAKARAPVNPHSVR